MKGVFFQMVINDIFERIESLLKVVESQDVTLSRVDRIEHAMELHALAFDLRVNKIPRMESESEDLAKAKQLEVKAMCFYNSLILMSRI
jgi:hypothetical protein